MAGAGPGWPCCKTDRQTRGRWQHTLKRFTCRHRAVLGVLGVGFIAEECHGGAHVSHDSMFIVTELCSGGALGEKILAQMAVKGWKVLRYSSYLLGQPSISPTVPRLWGVAWMQRTRVDCQHRRIP